MGVPSKRKSKSSVNKSKEIISISIKIITVITAMVTCVSVLINIYPKNSEIEIQILSKDQLTPYLNIPGLKGQFNYAGKTVKDLWKMKIRMLNSGDVTIFGKGPKKNIQNNSITLKFVSNLRVLAPQLDFSSFPHYIESDAHLYNELKLHFSQWRSGEDLIYSIHLIPDESKENISLHPFIPDRELTDGDIFVIDQSQLNLVKSEIFFNHLPQVLVIIGKVLGGAFSFSSILIVIFLLFIVAPTEGLTWFRWKSRYSKELQEYLIKNADHPDFGMIPVLHLDTPWILPDSVWLDFPGIKCPVCEPYWLTWKRAVVLSVFGLAIIIANLTLFISLVGI